MLRPVVEAQINPIVAENLLPGDIDWDISGAGDPSIQGFASDISVNKGTTVGFKIKTDATSWGIDIYRLGYYSGAGARKVQTLGPFTQAQNQAVACTSDTATGNYDCGAWATSVSWAIPSSAVSGIYIAKLTRSNPAGSSHIVFIVRDDARQADVLMQTADTTWQAYNKYGGASLYCAPGDNLGGIGVSNEGSAYNNSCARRAVAVSYNRPFDTRSHNPTSFLFNAEYPMVRFLEANGYDVKYWSGVDTDRRGADLAGGLKPKAFLSVGHDEYWSGNQRTRVETARDAGVSLAFFSGNEVYWKTRYEASIDGTNTAYRTLISYKDTLAGVKLDPMPNVTTGTWRDTRFGPPVADGGRPENALIGAIWTVNSGTAAISVPSEMKALRLWRNTRVADLTSGSATLGVETLGYEWGEDLDNGFRPAGLLHLSSTTVTGVEKILDFGSTVGIGTATHNLTMYRHNSGALVFGASSVQWSWGLDGEHDRGSPTTHPPDQAMQQATVNLLADMGAQPGSLQLGADPARRLLASSASPDFYAPTSVLTFPSAGGQVESGSRVTISGTAADNGGGTVAAVEVSADAGTTWHAAQGTSTWSYEWSPGTVGSATLRARAVDDSGNLEAAGPGITVSVVLGECPCTSLWKGSTIPANPSSSDGGEYELGVKFTSDIDGFITGIRFYKGPANNGTHVGNLWSVTGTLLATAVFTNETGTGWQQVSFGAPVAIAANTTYVASYHTPNGGYAFDPAYFVTTRDAPPLHAPTSATSGGNGVYSPGGVAFPTQTFNANNYWVDVVFAQSLADSTPPAISAITATAIDSSRATVSWATDEQASTRIDYGTDPAILTASISNLPAGTLTVTKPSFVTQHAVSLSGLQPNTTYYFLITAVDHSGNTTTLAAPTFTVPGPTLRDTAYTDFGAGQATGAYVSQTGDGEVRLAPTAGAEFNGPGLPSGWIEMPWDSAGYSVILDGILLVDGARVATCATDANGVCVPGETATSTPSAIYTAPHSLEFSANFSGDQFQHAGFAVTFGSASEPWAIFSTLNGGLLHARTNTGNGSIDTAIGVGPLGEFHRYRIDWKPASVDYYVDGALVVTHNVTVAGPMRPVAASDFNPYGGIVFIDWMRLSPVATPGTFVSRVFDATSAVSWNSVQWTARTPAGTGLAVSVRTGNTLDLDGSVVGSWTAVAAPGPLSGLSSRYIQYRAEMTSADPDATPELEDIIISTGHAPVAVADSAQVPQAGNRTFPASGPGSLTFNDTDADLTDTLRVVAVTPPAHGTAVVNGDGSVTYTPTPTYNGPDAFTYTVSDGLLTATAAVTLDVRFGNIAPVANADFYTATEDTTLTVLSANGILANDTDFENDPKSAVLVTLPAHGMLTLSANGGFSYTPALNYAGPDVFTYKVFDGADHGNIASVQILVSQVNDAPMTVADAFTAMLEVSLDVPAPGVLANDRDVEVEDTAPLHAELVTPTTHGQLTFRADGSFSYVPEANYLGTDSFTYRAADHFNATGNTVSVTLTVALKAVTQVVTGGTPVSTGTGVSAADPLQSQVTSPANGTVAIAQGVISGSQSPSGYTFLNQQVNITITGVDGTEVTAAAANPIRLVFTIDRSLIPAGQDHLSFQMFRNGVLIPNCPGATTIPAANLDPCVTAREDGPALNNNVRLTILTSHASAWNMGLSAADLGDTLVALNDPTTGTYAVDFETPLVVSAPGVLGNDYATASVTAVLSGTPLGGTVVLSTSGGFTFTPAAGLCGPASFKYKAHDGLMESTDATVSLLIDCTPHAGDDATTVLEDSGSSTITVLSNDTDPDTSQTLAVIAVTPAANGVVAIVGSGMAVSYAPQADFFGTDTFTYTVGDGHNGTATATVTITVRSVNDAPAFTKGANQTVSEDAPAQAVAGWATGLSAGPASESGQAVSFIVSNNYGALFSVQPAIAADGTLTYTPAPSANGSATVTVQIHDDGGTADGGVDTSDAQTFVVNMTPVNSKPTATSSSVTATLGVGTPVTLSGSDLETAAGSLAFTVGSPLHGTLSGTAPNLTYHPAAGYTGPDSLTYTLTDRGDPSDCGAAGLLCAAALTSDPATVSITVIKAGSSTTLASSASQSVFGSPITLTATVTPIPAGSAVPAGSMTFMDGAATVGSAPVNAGIATLTTSGLTAGSHSITAVYAGDSSFDPSASSAVGVVVSKADPVVTATATTCTYDGNPCAATASAAGVNGETLTPVTLAYSLVPGPGSLPSAPVNAGTYQVVAQYAGDANYNAASSASAAVTINKAPASVTPNAASKTYGTTDPALSGTLSGFRAADTVTAAYSRAAGETVAGGPYTISAVLTPAGVLGNYEITSNPAVFTINKALATVTAGGGTKVFGTADPALGATTATGFTAADAPAIALNSTRAVGEAVGNYATTATATGAALGNYTATYVPGTFSITKAPTTTSVSTTLTPANYGQLLTFQSSVSSANGGTPTGTVTFMAGSAALGTGILDGTGLASLSLFVLTPGTHAITASYGGDGTYSSSGSAALGQAIVAVPLVMLEPTSGLSFAGQEVGRTSAQIPVTMTNTGVAPLAIASIQVTGADSAAFIISSKTCGTSLAVGASCVVNVKFRPVTTGISSSTLTFKNNDNGVTGSTQVLALTGSGLSTIHSNFTNQSIPAGSTIWFNSALSRVKGPRSDHDDDIDMSATKVQLFVTGASISFTANGVPRTLPVPDSIVTFSPTATTSTTAFDTVNNRWLITVPSVDLTSKHQSFDIDGDVFASGLAFPVPTGGLPGGINNVTWSASYWTDTPGVNIHWEWSAAVYSTFSTNYNALNVKPVDSHKAPSAYANADPAGTPEAFKPYVRLGATGRRAGDYVGSRSYDKGVLPDVNQATVAPMPLVFATQAPGTTSAPKIVTITNNHVSWPVVVSSMTNTGGDFTIATDTTGANPCTLGATFTLAGQASCTVAVTFTPLDLGTRTSQITVRFAAPPGVDADEAPAAIKVNLAGTGGS